MASLAVNARNLVPVVNGQPRPDLARLQSQKGDPTTVRATRTDFSSRQSPPRFIRVHCPDALMSDLSKYVQEWAPTLVISEVPNGADIIADNHRYRIEHNAISSTDQDVDFGKLQRSVIEPMLAGWNAKIIGGGDGVFEFQVGIADLIQCSNVLQWPDDVMASVVFDELSYDQSTGIHIVSIDYSRTGKGPTAVEEQARRYSKIVSHNTGNIVIAVPRTETLSAFVTAVGNKYRSVSKLYERRYFFPPNIVDDIAANGGEIDLTMTDLESMIVDRLA